jgi:hypothetical protein
MWEQMFPKLKITKQTVTTTNSVIIFSSLLWNNDIPKLKKYMVRDLKFSSKLVNQIEFLVRLGEELDLYYDNHEGVNTFYVYKLAKMKNQYNIGDDLIIDYLGSEYQPFIDYCNDGFVISGNDLAAEGFKGREIETEKQRRETERFRSDYLNI